MSTIEDTTMHNLVWYNKKVMLKKEGNKRILLNFEGVDYTTKVWINGCFAGSHTGGYAAFTLDITKHLVDGENNITVRVEDSFDTAQPRGKQRWKKDNFGCWYVQTTGIWKTVWIEKVSACYIEKVKITPDIDLGEVRITAKVKGANFDVKNVLSCEVSFNNHIVRKTELHVEQDYISFSISLINEKQPWSVVLWSPQNPNLYDISFTLSAEGTGVDQVKSYFGMRKISISGNKVLLNNQPLYQRLILDQGYWKESHLTPPSEEAMLKDIDLIMTAGYNGLRKHQKIEDQRFLYWCDRKGLLVWSEMAAAYTFHEDGMKVFTTEWMDIVDQNYNHPCIITWTPFNESWGIENIYNNVMQQKFTESIYQLTKAFDPMRPVIVNDGWEHTISDILTLHDYEEYGDGILSRYKKEDQIVNNKIPFNKHRYAFAKGYEYKGQPVIVSEYGGIAFSSKEGWGYGEQVKSEEEFIKRFDSITSAIKELDYVSGFCYTQVTDVQQEVNGLYTIDREPKVNIDEIKKINLK
jgi:beta-galactosidase/beta-glucuronidase